MGSYDEVRGRICRDLASLSIFFDLREAAFSTFSFWGRARMYVIFFSLVCSRSNRDCAELSWTCQVESSRFPEFQKNRPGSFLQKNT